MKEITTTDLSSYKSSYYSRKQVAVGKGGEIIGSDKQKWEIVGKIDVTYPVGTILYFEESTGFLYEKKVLGASFSYNPLNFVNLIIKNIIMKEEKKEEFIKHTPHKYGANVATPIKKIVKIDGKIKAIVRIDEVFKITGRGVVASCKIIEGKVSVGDHVVLGVDEFMVTGVEMFCGGNNVGLILRSGDGDMDKFKQEVLKFKNKQVNVK
jgi:hypothetical protein